MATKNPKVYFQRVHPRALPPRRMTKGSAGYDLYAIEDITIYPNDTKVLPTGITLELPDGYYGRLTDRSSMALKGFRVEAGTIDSDYRNEIKVLIRNQTKTPFTIHVGDRMAQLILQKYEEPQWIDLTPLFEDDEEFFQELYGKPKLPPRQRKIYLFIKKTSKKPEVTYDFEKTFMQVTTLSPTTTDEKDDDEERTGGFGSTGK